MEKVTVSSIEKERIDNLVEELECADYDIIEALFNAIDAHNIDLRKYVF